MELIKAFLKSIPLLAPLLKWTYRFICFRELTLKIMEDMKVKLEEVGRRQAEHSYKSQLPPAVGNGSEYFRNVNDERVSLTQKERKEKISVIIPGYNKADYTTKCLKTLNEHTPEEIDYEVIIVDDFSTEKLEDVLSNRVSEGVRDKISVLRNSQNLGFGLSIDRGVKEAKGDVIVLLNNDTFVTKGWAEALLSALDKDGDGIIGGKCLYPDGTIQHAGGVFYFEEQVKSFLPYHIYRGFYGNFPGGNKRRHFKWVTFAFVMMQRRLFEDLGGFDNNFINGYEDVDFCLRAAEMGYSILYEPKSVAYHLECSTRGYGSLREIENLNLLREKYGLIEEDDFRYYLEDGVPVEYGREYSNRLFIEKVKEMPFSL